MNLTGIIRVKKSVSNGDILYDSIYMTLLKSQT